VSTQISNPLTALELSESLPPIGVFSTHQTAGGAALACQRLIKALRQADEPVEAFHFSPCDPPGKSFSTVPVNPIEIAGQFLRRLRVSAGFRLNALTRPVNQETFDHGEIADQNKVREWLPELRIANIHWCAGFISMQTLAWIARERAPVVLTLHDQLALTGGCHFSGPCTKYQVSCEACPQLRPDLGRTKRRFEAKRKAYENIPSERLHVVAPSNWLASLASSSTLLSRFPVHVIPNSIDLNRFHPQDRNQARQELGLPVDRRIIAFVSAKLSNERKGGHLLGQIIARLKQTGHDAGLLMIGAGETPPGAHDASVLLKRSLRGDVQLAKIYAAADVTLLLSLEDNLPNTMLESLACSTPVVAFAAGGIPDFVINGETGALAPVGDVGAFGAQLADIIGDDARREALGKAGRKLVMRECAPERQAERYQKLFNTICAAS